MSKDNVIDLQAYRADKLLGRRLGYVPTSEEAAEMLHQSIAEALEAVMYYAKQQEDSPQRQEGRKVIVNVVKALTGQDMEYEDLPEQL